MPRAGAEISHSFAAAAGWRVTRALYDLRLTAGIGTDLAAISATNFKQYMHSCVLDSGAADAM
jgi:hypothetical protein